MVEQPQVTVIEEVSSPQSQEPTVLDDHQGSKSSGTLRGEAPQQSEKASKHESVGGSEDSKSSRAHSKSESDSVQQDLQDNNSPPQQLEEPQVQPETETPQQILATEDQPVSNPEPVNTEQDLSNNNSDEFLLFDKYSVQNIQVADKALIPYISLTPQLIVKSYGRKTGKFDNADINILERIANRLAVPGHVGKKHKIITSWSSGKYTSNMKTILKALDIIEKKTNKNPIQIVVDAIVKASPRDEITIIEHAGARYPQSVDVSPMRRINLVIRWIVQGSYQKCFGKKKKIAESLAEEFMKAADQNMESYSMQKKNESEKQADSAR